MRGMGAAIRRLRLMLSSLLIGVVASAALSYVACYSLIRTASRAAAVGAYTHTWALWSDDIDARRHGRRCRLCHKATDTTPSKDESLNAKWHQASATTPGLLHPQSDLSDQPHQAWGNAGGSASLSSRHIIMYERDSDGSIVTTDPVIPEFVSPVDNWSMLPVPVVHEQFATIVRIECGWPFRSMHAQTRHVWDSSGQTVLEPATMSFLGGVVLRREPLGYGGRPIGLPLPLRIDVPMFLLNAICFAMPVLLARGSSRAYIAHVRRRRSCCVSCGYQLDEIATTCPECGEGAASAAR